MDLLDQLTKEHRAAEQLLEKLSKNDPGGERDATIAELDAALRKHMQVEESRVYPLIRDRIGSEEVTEAQTEHDLVRDGLKKLGELASEPGFGAAVDMLKGGIGHHVEEEEQELFPKLRRRVQGDDLAVKPADIDLNDATRDVLYALASDVGIDGRSTMSKEELRAALSNA